MEEIAQWATETFSRLRSKQHILGADIQQLVVAGVAEHRIETLYPFSTGDYLPGIERALQDRSQHQAIFDALYSVNIPYNLSTHLPGKHSNELFNYVRQKALRTSRTGPAARISNYSTELAELAEAQTDLIPTIETMIQLPRWLHVMRGYPFPELDWPPNDKITFRGELLGATQADIEGYVALLP